MYCACCTESTEAVPCARCGADPLLDGRYRLLEKIGQGPNRTTWRAARTDGLTVAIKETILRRDAEELLARAEREAAVMRQLHHPNLPGYLEHLTTRAARTQSFWLVTEWIDGVDLERGLAEHRYTEAEVLSLLAELCPVLTYLHTLSPPIIHRDLKPSNLLRARDGRLVLTDFGAVRDELKGALGGSTVAGTFGYMAPEQFAGDASPKTDLYALGALAVALLTRTDPATLVGRERYGETFEAGRIVWRDKANVSAKTARLIDALLAPDPSKRPASAQDLKVLLERLEREDRALPAPRERPRPRLLGPSLFLALGIGLFGLSILVLSVLAGLGLLVGGAQRAPLSHANTDACELYVRTFNDAPCSNIDLPHDLCPATLDQMSCDISDYYACMARGVRCNGDFLDISRQASCQMPSCR